jgi:hypothetical protein
MLFTILDGKVVVSVLGLIFIFKLYELVCFSANLMIKTFLNYLPLNLIIPVSTLKKYTNNECKTEFD